MKLRHRLLLLFLALAAAGSLLVGFGATSVLRGAIEQQFLERISKEAALLAEEIAQAEDLDAFADAGATNLGVRVTLIDANGAVVADSAVDRLSRLDNHANRPEIVAAATRGFGNSRRASDSTHENYFYSARRVEGGGPVRYVRLALPVQLVVREQAGAERTILLIVGGSLLLLACVAYAAVRWFSKPVERIAEMADRIARGDSPADIPVPARQDELAGLAASINRMKGSLFDRIAGLRDERDRIATALAGMQEGLLIVGADERIALANPAARRILEIGFDPAGALLAEAVRIPKVLHAVERGDEGSDVLRLSAPERAFDMRVARLDDGATLLLLFDITRLEALERVRQEFLANVSHEMRTPLTSIKAFVETLLGGAADDEANRTRFLEIIQRHSERMEALIGDVTDLSLIETGAINLEPERLDLAEVAGDVVENLEPLIERYGVDVRIEAGELFVRGDRRRLEQVLRNLIENAVKFNREGGSVTLSGSREDGRPHFRVSDTGIGIPEDSLDQVFHRFYRVDASRSREAGGTGLGLAIVKHLMRLHDGEVRVESEFGSGSTFTLVFPRAA